MISNLKENIYIICVVSTILLIFLEIIIIIYEFIRTTILQKLNLARINLKTNNEISSYRKRNKKRIKIFYLLVAFSISCANYSNIQKELKTLFHSKIVRPNFSPVKEISSCGIEILTVLQDISSSAFFRYFRVNLSRECPFWQENGQCMIEACSVSVCPYDEIPEIWYRSDAKQENFGWISEVNNHYDYCTKSLSSLSEDMTVIQHSNMSLSYINYLNNVDDWTNISENNDLLHENDQFVNLLENPEKYTGYSGPSAQRVWNCIMNENCFGNPKDECLEKRIFYRLISGLRSSISIHIAREYMYPNGTWNSNIPLFMSTVGNYPERLNNLYFTFHFLLRALNKASKVLQNYHYMTSNITDDFRTKQLMNDLLSYAKKYTEIVISNSSVNIQSEKCNETILLKQLIDEYKNGFDESALFQSELNNNNSSMLLEEFKHKFRNISLIMDCVSCEKCQLWGKLQILGLGTAIKIILTNDNDNIILSKQEIISFINTLNQFIKSIDFVMFVSNRISDNDKIIGSYSVINIVIIVLIICTYIIYKKNYN